MPPAFDLTAVFGWFNHMIIRLPLTIGLLVMPPLPAATYAVVVFTILVQGLSLRAVVGRTI